MAIEFLEFMVLKSLLRFILQKKLYRSLPSKTVEAEMYSVTVYIQTVTAWLSLLVGGL